MAQQKLDVPPEPMRASTDISVALQGADVPSTAVTPKTPKPSEDWKAFWKPNIVIIVSAYCMWAGISELMQRYLPGPHNPFDYLGKFLLFAGLTVIIERNRRKGVFDFGTEEWTSKPSELPRLLEKAKQVAVLNPHDESEYVNVWNCLSYLSKKLHPHHKPHFDDDAVENLKHSLGTETLPERLVVLVRLATIAADSKLLPELKTVRIVADNLDPTHKLAEQIAMAIEACSKVEPKSVRAIGGLAK
jgi:hypothetical protein